MFCVCLIGNILDNNQLFVDTFDDLQGLEQFDSTVPSNKLSKSIAIADLL